MDPGGSGFVGLVGLGQLEPACDLSEDLTSVVLDVVDQRDQLAQAQGIEALGDDVEGGSLLAHDGHVLAAGQGVCDEVDDHRALAGAGWTIDHEQPLVSGALDGRTLAGICAHHRRPVGRWLARRGGSSPTRACAAPAPSETRAGAEALGEDVLVVVHEVHQALVVADHVGGGLEAKKPRTAQGSRVS